MTDEKTGYKILSYLAVFVALVCVFFKGFGTDSRELNRLQNDTDSTVGTIKVEQSSVGVEIGRSQVATGNAIRAIERSQSEIDGSRKAIDDFEARIRELQSLASECQRLATESKGIIDGVDKSN